jgi:hypothetical protein
MLQKTVALIISYLIYRLFKDKSIKHMAYHLYVRPHSSFTAFGLEVLRNLKDCAEMQDRRIGCFAKRDENCYGIEELT